MSIPNKSVYRKYLNILMENGQDNRIPCPICNDGTRWDVCNKHFSLELIYYLLALQWYIQFLETRTVQAEDRAMVCGKQNYELRNALSASKRNAKHYRNIAFELGDKIRTLNIDKR